MARSLAEGWGGGEVSLYSSQPDASGRVDDVVTHIALVWDTRGDYADFRSAYSEVLKGLDYGAPSSSNGGSRWDWTGRSDRDSGAALWDESRLRVDILFGTDTKAVQTGTKALADYAARQR